MKRKPLLIALWSLLLLAGRPESVLACAACYGQSDSAMAQGMNWGIFSLLGTAVVVLGCVGTFFVFLAKKSASVAAAEMKPKPPQETNSDTKHGTI